MAFIYIRPGGMATRSLALFNEKLCLIPPTAGIGMPPDPPISSFVTTTAKRKNNEVVNILQIL